MRFGFYDLIIGFDRQNRQAWIVSTGFPACDDAARNTRAQGRIETALGYLARPAPARQNAQPVTGWASNFTRDGFVSAVHKTRDYIAQGDIYQANLTQRFTAPLPPHFDPWAFYRNLRATNPAPFSAYLQDGDTVFASSSPERFIQLQNGTLEARPIKGTTARGPTNAEDQARAKALVASEKDRAENVMIVDLLRNDMSRVCQPGSVHVPTLCGLESYASVHHLTSVVQGQIQTGLGPVDVIKACFPGGSITGAPKIRAMDIITELEQVARGVYCGAIGYIGFDGNMDLNIAIRTAIIGAGHAVVQAGGGITLLSDPQAEYDETLTKADRLFAAFAASS
jgi:para-aminobenzoate synthetase component 1